MNEYSNSAEKAVKIVYSLFSALSACSLVSDVVVSEFVDEKLGRMIFKGEQSVVSVKLIGHSSLLI